MVAEGQIRTGDLGHSVGSHAFDLVDKRMMSTVQTVELRMQG